MKTTWHERFPPDGFPGAGNEHVQFLVPQSLDQPEYVAQHRQWQVDRARELRNSFERGRTKRQRSLRKQLAYRHRYNTVLAMTLNRGFCDLLLNWVASCDRHDIDVRSWTVIAALDEETAARIEALGFTVYLASPDYGRPGPDAATAYGDPAFRDMMFPKTAIVQDLLEIGHDVLFQDVDVIWKKDPGKMLFDPGRAVLDAQFMYDGPNPHYGPLHANSGFFLLRNNGRTRKFWGQVFDHFDKVYAYAGQQRHINMLLVAHYFRGLRLDILPEAAFANGHLFSSDDVSGLPADPAVVHFSWTRDLAHKMDKYHRADLWYL